MWIHGKGVRAPPRKASLRHETGVEETQAGFPFSLAAPVTDNLLAESPDKENPSLIRDQPC